MNIVALTGGIGSGKSAACEVFKKLDVPVVDLDEIAHELTACNGGVMSEIAKVFGHEYALENGALNRDLMRQKVFDDPLARQQLNNIIHPAIYQAAYQAFERHEEADYQVLAIPLLDKKSPYMEIINHVLVIDCPEKVQLDRVMARSQLGESTVKKIIAAQISRAERLALADTVIENDTTLENFKQNVLNFHQNYIKTCIVSK